MGKSLTKCCRKVEEELAGRRLPTSKEVREERAAISRAHMARYAPGPGYVWNPETGLFEHELSSPSSPPYANRDQNLGEEDFCEICGDG